MEKLDDLGQRLAKVETQQQNLEKTMERHQTETQGFVYRTEARLTGLIADLKLTMMEGQRALDHAINGNGKPGLADRMRDVEDEVVRIKEGNAVTVSNADRAWTRNSAIVAWIIAILIALAGYFTGRAGK